MVAVGGAEKPGGGAAEGGAVGGGAVGPGSGVGVADGEEVAAGEVPQGSPASQTGSSVQRCLSLKVSYQADHASELASPAPAGKPHKRSHITATSICSATLSCSQTI